jgi:hypothetical protein
VIVAAATLPQHNAVLILWPAQLGLKLRICFGKHAQQRSINQQVSRAVGHDCWDRSAGTGVHVCVGDWTPGHVGRDAPMVGCARYWQLAHSGELLIPVVELCSILVIPCQHEHVDQLVHMVCTCQLSDSVFTSTC